LAKKEFNEFDLLEIFYREMEEKGLGVVLSKRVVKEKNKTIFQKISNFATNHKALSIESRQK
jgi:hypothetical protein